MKSMILAVDKNGGIGYKGGLPLPRIDEDMAWFRHVTMQHKRCIMGRKTWESVGKLEGRECHVVTRCTPLSGTVSGMIGATIHTTPPPLEDGDIVIGGASMYKHYADQVDVVFLTEVDIAPLTKVDGGYNFDVRVDLEYLLKYQSLRGQMMSKDNHMISVYARSWRIGERVDKAVGMLESYLETIPSQPTISAKELAASVDNPAHYTQGGIETIDAIGAVTTGYTGEDAFCAGNVVKYISRAPFKGSKKEDLQKALWYLKRLIDGGENDS